MDFLKDRKLVPFEAGIMGGFLCIVSYLSIYLILSILFNILFYDYGYALFISLAVWILIMIPVILIYVGIFTIKMVHEIGITEIVFNSAIYSSISVILGISGFILVIAFFSEPVEYFTIYEIFRRLSLFANTYSDFISNVLFWIYLIIGIAISAISNIVYAKLHNKLVWKMIGGNT